MLALPEVGFYPSVNKHNVRLDIVVDWIEGSVVFIDSALSWNDVIDALCENGVYRNQDFATERVIDAWTELARRARCLHAGAPFEVDSRRIRRCHAWDKNLSYSFCMLLSLQVWFSGWARRFVHDYTEQGELFERLTAESLEHLGWSVHRAGWTPGNPARIRLVVQEVSAHIAEPEIPGQLERWISESANDEGLDIVCSAPFPDGWGGRPLYFLQCASGANWVQKLSTPDPDTWRRIIDFTNVPKRGMSMPFALLQDEFRMNAGRVNGMLIDRYRLQSPSVDGELQWISRNLSGDIMNWMRPRVRVLPDDAS